MSYPKEEVTDSYSPRLIFPLLTVMRVSMKQRIKARLLI